jgi:hypothetical protein
MRCGCIAIGEIKCDLCKRIIEHGERYLLIAEDGEAEDKNQRFCVDCSVKENYAVYVKEKGEQVLTFLAEQRS